MKSLESSPIVHVKNGKTYALRSADRVEANEAQAEDVRRICNQEDVYRLFGDRFQGRPYALDDAKGFFRWANAGWAEKSHFVFFVSSPEGAIAAAMDIKSADLTSAEIGYWCDQGHRGITGAGVARMIAWARDNGFQEVFARPNNERSQNLLSKQGFHRIEDPQNEFGRWVLPLGK